MHIAFVHKSFPPEGGWGGIGMYNYHMALALRELGHKVTVLSARVSEDVPPVQEKAGIRILRLLVSDWYYLRRLPALGRYFYQLVHLVYGLRVSQVIQKLQNQQPLDLIEFAEINAEGFFSARTSRVPIVVRCHTPSFVLKQYLGWRETSSDTRIVEWCEKDFIRRADALSAPSRDMAQIIANESGVSIHNVAVIPNALSLEGFPDPFTQLPDHSNARAPNHPITILHVGRLEKGKGVTVLTQAIPHVIREVPQARFVFVGYDRSTVRGTSQRAELESMLIGENVDSQVEFLGALNQTALMDCYRNADICVVPSLIYESFSYTCAQGMAAGKPVVASRIGGIPETVDEGVSGFLVTPGDENELADAIVRLARDPSLRAKFGRAGRDKVACEYNPVKIACLNLELYTRAISRQQHLQE